MADPLTDFLTHLTNSVRAGKETVEWERVSNLLINVLEVMKRHGYIKEYEVIELPRNKRKVRVTVSEYLNKAGAIKPRFPVGRYEYEEYEKRYLPARDFGILIVSTSQGVMSHKEAKEKGIGGVLVAFVY